MKIRSGKADPASEDEPLQDADPASEDEPLQDADPFDPKAIRISPDYGAVGVKRVLTSVRVGKPPGQEFVRVCPAPEYRVEVGLLELKQEREHYLVMPAMHAELAQEMVLVRLYLAITRGGAAFFWPVRLPGPDGHRNPWHESAERAAQLAIQNWVRITANMHAGGYDTFVASAPLAEPEWPDLPMNELLKLAFGDRYIASLDHPVIRRLRGLA